MEISEHELERLVAHADDEHRASLPDLAANLADQHCEQTGGGRGPSRRRVLQGAAFGGLAITVGGAVFPLADLVTPAAAADKVPTDAELVAFAESVERALTTVYTEAAGTAVVTLPGVRTLFTTFAGHHQQHAAAFSALGGRIGSTSKHQPNPKLLDVGRGQLRAARDLNHALDLGFLLEASAAATYVVALGILTGGEAQRLSASVLPVESQHAAAFGVARGLALGDTVPTFITTDRALDPTKYPAA